MGLNTCYTIYSYIDNNQKGGNKMSFLEFKVLRFNNRFWIKDGKIVSDNENGNNAMVVPATSGKKNLECAGNILIENNPDLIEIFKGTKPFGIEDLDYCITCLDNRLLKIQPKNGDVYTSSFNEDEGLSFKMDGSPAYFSHMGIPWKEYLLTDKNCARSFERYINKKINRSVKVNFRASYIDVMDIFTGEIFSIIRQDGDYNLLNESSQEEKWKNVALKEVGIKEFYDIIEQDIDKHCLTVNEEIIEFLTLHMFFNYSKGFFNIGSKQFEDIKNAKMYALYDKLYIKGTTTLVPGEDSTLIGYYVTCNAKMLFDEDSYLNGYSNVIMNMFLDKTEKEYALENLKEQPIRKRNLTSQCFTLKFNNDVDNPRVFYEGDSGETIELIQKRSVSLATIWQ